MKISQISYTERHLLMDLFDRYSVFYGRPSDKRLVVQYLLQRLRNYKSIIFVATEENGDEEYPLAQTYPIYAL